MCDRNSNQKKVVSANFWSENGTNPPKKSLLCAPPKTGFPELYSNSYLIFLILFFFSLYYQLCEKKKQNTEKTLSILMRLKGSDCVKKQKLNDVRLHCPLGAAYANRKPVKFQRACRMNSPNQKSSMRSSFSLNISFFIWKAYIETNNIINIAMINFKLVFYGGMLDLVDDCHKRHGTNSARQ